jgi:hypothetical protein
LISEATNVKKDFQIRGKLYPEPEKRRGPEPRPLLQATILFHLRGRLMISSFAIHVPFLFLVKHWFLIGQLSVILYDLLK